MHFKHYLWILSFAERTDEDGQDEDEFRHHEVRVRVYGGSQIIR